MKFAPKPLLDSSIDYWRWQDTGLCNSEDPEAFFTDENIRGREKKEKEIRAKKICAKCPVKNTCLEHALRTPEVFGIWGGLTELERSKLGRVRKPKDRKF